MAGAKLEYPKAWWKEAVVYQIYPISFFDSNGDGFGDLNGILAKLDYLKDLGVDVLWLSPIYKSPLADMGYDIADYEAIDPRYGTLEDWDRLMDGIHARGMKLIMDLVVNHTSDEHEWFKESRSSRSNPKRDWYIWRPPKYDTEGNRQPPNNWRSMFQGSAWEYDEETGEYYLHIYLSKQPDLNWNNRTVREAVYKMMRFWLDRGCDGFRMDVINLISKVDGLPEAPIADPDEKYQLAVQFFANGPRVHEYIREMRENVLSKYDIMTVGETPMTHDTAQIDPYVIPPGEELNMVFQFELMDLDHPKTRTFTPLVFRQWSVAEFREVITRWQTYKREEGYWNAVYIENHDHTRSVSRFGNDSDEWRAVSAKMLAILEVTLSGTQYVYQGQELGMKNFPRTWGIEEYKDVASINYWNRILEERREKEGRKKVDMEDVLTDFAKKARDHCRTPMQWDSGKHGGFTTGTPWMRVNDDSAEWNAINQLNDDNSVLSFWVKALKFRKNNDFLIYGDFVELSQGHPQVIAYLCSLGPSFALVVLNFDATPADYQVPVGRDWSSFHFAFGNYNDTTTAAIGEVLSLKGYEGRVYVKSA